MTDTNLRPSTDDYADFIKKKYGYMLGCYHPYVCRGWEGLIQNMLKELHDDVKAHNEFCDTGDDHPVLTTFWHEYGILRVCGYNISDTQQAIIDRHAAISAKTCYWCGEFGRMRGKGHSSHVACDKHVCKD